MALTEKSIENVKRWITESNTRAVAIKLIDIAIKKEVGLTSSDLADTVTFANGIDKIELMLNKGGYQSAYDQAKKVAAKMLKEEGYGKMQEGLTQFVKKELTKLHTRTLLEGRKRQIIKELSLLKEYDNYNYPAGADADPNAPWHEKDYPELYLDNFEVKENGDSLDTFYIVAYASGGGYTANPDEVSLDRILKAIDADQETYQYFIEALAEKGEFDISKELKAELHKVIDEWIGQLEWNDLNAESDEPEGYEPDPDFDEGVERDIAPIDESSNIYVNKHSIETIEKPLIPDAIAVISKNPTAVKFTHKGNFDSFLGKQKYFSASQSHCFYSQEDYDAFSRGEDQWMRDNQSISEADKGSLMMFETGHELVAVWDSRNSIGYIVPKNIMKEGYDRKSLNIQQIVDSYLEAALWVEGEEDEFKEKTIYDVEPDSREAAKKDVITFLTTAKSNREALAELKKYSEEQIGHNLWLSRNGHGAGFFDDYSDNLQKIARDMGSKNIYTGDDGNIYIS